MTQSKNWLSGQELTYQYDVLNRLLSAATTDPQVPQWGQAFGYDGFENLLTKAVTKGSAPVLNVTVNGATNRINGVGYDENGNQAGPASVYDIENRLLTWDGAEQYRYGPDNKRMFKRWTSAGGVVVERYYFYGVNGKVMAELEAKYDPGLPQTTPGLALTAVVSYRYVGVRRVGFDEPLEDRLGTRGAGASYYPYGDGAAQFATYEKDGSGLHYADQRYYHAGYGRFLTSDPYVASGVAGAPGSWNQYAYVEGDPGNYHDPAGLQRWMVTIYYSHCSWYGPTATLNCAPGSYSYIVDDGLDGGGGGGGAGGSNPEPQPPGALPRRVVTITNLSKKGSSYDKVNNRLTNIENEIDDDCLGFLQSGGHELARHIHDLRNSNLLAVGNFNRNNIAAITGTYGSNLAEGEAAIVVNTNGAFFRNSYTVNQGSITGGTAKAQVFILPHELAHSLEAKGFLPDLNNAPNGEANDKMIETNCAKTLARFQ